MISIICTKQPMDGRIDAPGLRVTYDELHLTNWAFIFNFPQMDKRLDIQVLRR